MKNNGATQETTGKGLWQSTQYGNIVKHRSGIYYARIRVSGKLIWRSLRTQSITTAKLRLDDVAAEERKNSTAGTPLTRDKVLFSDCVSAYKAAGYRPAIHRTPKDSKPLKPAAVAYYDQRMKALLESWPELAKMDIRKITEAGCRQWADKQRQVMSASAFNHTISALRHAIGYGIKMGVRYNNPASVLVRMSETAKQLQLPSHDQFKAFVLEIENAGSGFSKACADLVRFLAFTGLRKSEAAHVTWADCDMDKGIITVRGPETGLKNRQPGEVRHVPLIPDARMLLERLKSARPDDAPEAFVMTVRECQKAMDRAARTVGMPRISHHDLRHLFATRCIESGVDIPTVARWLGHRDGGALAMKVYGHLRDQHSATMAQRVTFAESTTVYHVIQPSAKNGMM